MLETALTIAFGLFVLALLLNLYRLLRGPTLPDRALALDTMYINAIALIVLYGIANDSKLYLLESEGPQENIEPVNAQIKISDAHEDEKQAPAKFVSKSQRIRQQHEVQNTPITDSTSTLIEKSKSAIDAEVKRQEMRLYNPEYFQIVHNPELEGELIAVSLVDKMKFKDEEEKKQQCMKETKSQDVTLIDCNK